MEAALLLGFEEEAKVVTESSSLSSSSSSARRLVPWLNWDEWLFVKHALFSNSPHSLSSALKRISAWRSRGSLPVLIEVTASIIEIQHKDPYFRQDQSNDASLSEEMLAMLYCMAIMRLVNGAVEKTRKKEVASIAVAADAIRIPRMLIDIRHEGSHRELPSLKIVRSASVKALDWLKSYYWEPQSKAIPFQGEGIEKFKKEIKSKIRELAICLKVNGSAQSSSSLLKGKRVKHGELAFGRNKLLSLMVVKHQTSRTVGSKKQIMKILKYILRLYSSFSSEIVSVLLEYLLKALRSSELEENADDASIGLTIQNALADWKLVIHKLCNKEPELLLNLLKEVLDMIETREDMKYEEDNPNIGILQSRTEFQRSDYLSSLFAWLVGILSKVPSAAANMPKRVFLELLRRCLLISQLCNKQLVDSALQLAVLMDDSYLMGKVQKFSLISLSNLDNADDQSSLLSSKNIFQFEESILEAAKKLEFVKQQVMKNKKPTAMDCNTKKSQTWTLAKSWNPCPIGMLPRAVGSSGCLPVLNIIDDEKHIGNEKQNQVTEKKENWKLTQHGTKRDATLDLPRLDNSTVKKMRETKEFGEIDSELAMQGEKGCLMVGGVWKKLTEEELLAIESSVRILV
ncbi:Ribosomal biogenesis protein LAS1L [Mucuna pruriens]|uniref:Ribosomal biogenesis protein LAS1L n=1 Tax=Mucuna pruriens TaxID=157652 RepID=A0A371I0S7_MUCPR|nr:Ribosomal biogenesis protein LAS1L [Mucuna pruriens]